MDLQPILHWAGGKRQLLPIIRQYIPTHINRYYESFLGGGALFFELQHPNCVINDSNKEIINLYNTIKFQPEDFIESLKKMNINERTHYIKVRDIDREKDWEIRYSSVYKAARTLYLNRTGYNGLYRINSKGQFNVPFGKHKNPMKIDEKLIYDISFFLNEYNIHLLSVDFEKVFELYPPFKNDFVYFDPPYYPISKTSNFTSYTKEGFNEEDHIRLFNLANELTSKGVKVMISNSSADFVRSLYQNWNVVEIDAKRCINSNPNKRGNIKELLIMNYEI